MKYPTRFMNDIQFTCRITYGKFSYFLPPDWVFSVSTDIEDLRQSVEQRWRTIKGDPELVVDHFRIQVIREGLK